MLQAEIGEVVESHRPSKHTFFNQLAACQSNQLLAGDNLENLYVAYQAAMHATRVMVYFLPHLDSVDLRMEKIKILIDDDAQPNGDSHHAQLRRTWEFMLGRAPTMSDVEFGELNFLAPILDPATGRFVTAVERLYRESLGPWIVVEGLAHDWIGALLRGLQAHFPGVEQTDYFVNNFYNEIELGHAKNALNTANAVVARRPSLLSGTLQGAAAMGKELDLLWSGFETLLFGN